MNIDKQKILQMLRSRGEHAAADQAQNELPDQVDTDLHRAKLNQLGINPDELLAGARNDRGTLVTNGRSPVVGATRLGSPSGARVASAVKTDTVTRRYRRGLAAPWGLALVGVPAILAAVGLGLDGDDDARASQPSTSQSSGAADGRNASASAFSAERVGNEVTLQGTVPDEAARTGLVNDVKARIPGANVIDKLKVQAGAPAPAAAVTALAAAANTENFSLQADGQSVVLKGVAASEEAKAAAGTAAKSAFPRASVDNQLTVRGAEAPSATAPGGGCADLAADITAITDQTKITFPNNQATPSPASRTALAKIAQTWKGCPQAPVLSVKGYTSSPGSSENNQSLSQARARGAADVLISAGVPANKVVAKGYGETNFIASNSTEAGRDANRRVEITVG